LNLAGTFIWERGDGQGSLAEIVAALVDDDKVTPEEGARDCQEFIDSLVEQGLLHWSVSKD
jgi:hypothetical protein